MPLIHLTLSSIIHVLIVAKLQSHLFLVIFFIIIKHTVILNQLGNLGLFSPKDQCESK